MKKLSEQYALKLKQSSVTEASDSNFQPSWRGTEAVEASDSHENGPLLVNERISKSQIRILSDSKRSDTVRFG